MHVMGFQPAATPGLSKQGLFEIAQMVKAMLHDEISEQVKLKVDAATKSLQTELNTTKAELNNTKDALVNMKTLVDDLQSKVSNLELKQIEAERYARRMCLRTTGIAESINEDVTKTVLDFAATGQLYHYRGGHRSGASCRSAKHHSCSCQRCDHCVWNTTKT